MSDQDLFENDKDKPATPVTPEPGKAPQSSDYTSILSGIVNQEGKPKYATVEDALKGAAHAQAHIAKLEQEMAELKAKTESAKKIEDLIGALEAKKDPTKENSKEPTKVDPADIQKIVQDVLQDVNQKATKEQNVKTVTSVFKKLYNDKASETLYGKAEDLGMSKAEINSLIASNPKAALKLLGVEDKPSKDVDPTSSTVDPSRFQGQPPQKPKSVMGYVSNKDLTESWLATKQKTLKQLGIEK